MTRRTERSRWRRRIDRKHVALECCRPSIPPCNCPPGQALVGIRWILNLNEGCKVTDWLSWEVFFTSWMRMVSTRHPSRYSPSLISGRLFCKQTILLDSFHRLKPIQKSHDSTNFRMHVLIFSTSSSSDSSTLKWNAISWMIFSNIGHFLTLQSCWLRRWKWKRSLVGCHFGLKPQLLTHQHDPKWGIYRSLRSTHRLHWEPHSCLKKAYAEGVHHNSQKFITFRRRCDRQTSNHQDSRHCRQKIAWSNSSIHQLSLL